MTNRIRGTNSRSISLQERLDQIQMPSYQRLTAQAHLARAEAIAELIAAGIHKVGSLAHSAKALVAWPTHRAS